MYIDDYAILANVHVGGPVNAGRLRSVMGCIPLPVMMVVVVIIAPFVAYVAAGQGNGDRAEEENEAQCVFERVVHKSGF